MRFMSLRGLAVALAMTVVGGAAHAFTAKGNYDVTFNVVGGGQVEYCVTLVSQGAGGPYRDTGSATFYSGGSQVGAGTYVVFQKMISVAITTGNDEYLTAAGSFSAGQAFNTAVIDFNGNATILGTATFQYVHNGGSCAKAAA